MTITLSFLEDDILKRSQCTINSIEAVIASFLQFFTIATHWTVKMWYICVRYYQCTWHSSAGWVTSSPLWINQCKIEDKSGKENASVIKCLSMVMEFARPTLNPRRCDSRGTSLEKSPGPRYAHCHLSTCWHLVSQLESRSHFWIPGQITYMKRSSVKFELSNQDGSFLFTKATVFYWTHLTWCNSE